MRATAVRFAALGACALIPLMAQAAPKLRAPSFQAPSKDAPILLQADEIVYDSEANTVSAVGHVEIADEVVPGLVTRIHKDQRNEYLKGIRGDTLFGRCHIKNRRDQPFLMALREPEALSAICRQRSAVEVAFSSVMPS
jgi:hypothetical protein